MAVKKDRDNGMRDVAGADRGQPGGALGGKSTGAGQSADPASNALFSGGSSLTQNKERDNGMRDAAGADRGQPSAPPGGKATASGSGDSPTITRVGTPQVMPSGWTATPSATDEYDNTGRLKAVGTTGYVADPSLGQFAGLGAMLTSPFSAITASADAVLNGGQFTGGPLGRFLDGLRGVEPGQVVGYVGNRVASSTNSRGDVRATDDTRLFDRASTAARDQIAGGSTDVATGGDDGGAEFSSVKLADRRRPYDTTSAVDLLRGLL